MTAAVDPKTHYQQDGFYICPQPVIPATVAQEAIAGMDAVRAGEYDTGASPQPSAWNPGDDPHKLCKIEMPQIASNQVRALVSYPALGEMAAAVTGAKAVQVWWVQLLYKPPVQPGIATNIGWHQDQYYWRIWEDGSELFTAWVALSDVTADSGPMKFVPGSHLWGFTGEGDFWAADHERQRDQITVPAGQTWTEVPAILPPGGVSFHHNLTFHASGANISASPRRSFAIHLRTEKSRPQDGRRQGLTQFIDNLDYCPVIYGSPDLLG